jgi:MFS family permease
VGFGAAGLFLTTESWLNAKAAPAERGRVFSLYMVGTFAALALGQLLIGRAEVMAFRPFNLIAALFAAALLMVTTTRAEPPARAAPSALPWGRLSRRAPLAVLGCGTAGLLGGAFYALVPAWMRGEGIAQSTIALFMFVAVLGGLAFQVPVGRLSDRIDRRRVMALVAAGFAAGAVGIVQLPPRLAAVLPVALVLGGFMSTLYPVCVAHAHDWMPADQVVEVSGRLIFVNGVGSSLGPLLGALVMGAFGIDGLFYFMAAVATLLGVAVLARSARVQEPEHHARPFDVLAPQAAPLGHAYREVPEEEAA